VGAAARDIHFLHVHGIRPGRATVDVDFALLAPSWDAFNDVMTDITRDKGYTRDEKLQHRAHSASGVMFDLIPFGAIEEPGREIRWPPDFDHVMSTVEFQDALDAAQVCRIRERPLLEIRIASIPGLAVLKLIAWADHFPSRAKDAMDLQYLLRNYDAGQYDRLFSEEENIVALATSQYEMAVARLLGRDVGRMVTAPTRQVVREILEAEMNIDGQMRLVSDMLIGSEDGADVVLGLLKEFRNGLNDEVSER
ncbi:MAG: nucleotidyl transferase AbiEii/AbiGii toxin family protein, partial [Bacteroidota bacterium]|nr:nucleotidyl transferase AbiEii/AbiGii toxin family protein [Bacteroidota bacterium]